MNNIENKIYENSKEFDSINQETNKTNQSNLQNLLEKNIELSEQILDLTKYIKKYIVWQKIFSWIKTVVIVTPIVFGIIYLIPYFKDFSNTMQKFSDVMKQAYSITPY